MFHFRRNAGFTLIELLIVFSIISILSAASIASFVNYRKIQQLAIATTDVASLMKTAKSRAQSQVKPPICGSATLDGYEIRICGLTGSLCAPVNTYELYVSCGGTTSRISTHKLQSEISFSNTGTTSPTFFFHVLNNSVTGSGIVALQGNSSSKTITVSPQGALTIQ